MPKPQESEAVALVFDVGNTVAGGSDDFYSKAKQCLSRVLERKLLFKSSDHVCLILIGSEASDEGYEHVTCPFDLELPSWDMVRFVRTKIEPTQHTADWLDGVVMAADKLRLSSFSSKRIVLFSDFTATISDSQIKTIVQHIKRMDLGLLVFGPNYFQDIIDEDSAEPESKRFKMAEERTESEMASSELIRQMWEELGEKMEVYTIGKALRHLTSLPAIQEKSKAWNCLLEIGDIKINVGAYVKIKPGTKKPVSRTQIKVVVGEKEEGTQLTPTVPVKTVKEMTCLDIDENRVVVTKADVIKGVKYGASIIPLNEADKEAMKYKSGPKGLFVLGFTNLKLLNRIYVVGTGCHVIAPEKNNPAAAMALSTLIQALNETSCAAVARKVYSTDRGLNLVLLSPVREQLDGGYYKECLVMNELTWKEGVKQVVFPSLDVEVNEEQISAVDALIDSMNLMTADKVPFEESTEAFKIPELYEEKNAFYMHCLVERALFPEKPIPDKLPPHLDAFSWPESVKEKSSLVKQLFPITILEDKDTRKERWQNYVKTQQERNHQEEEEGAQPVQIKLDYPQPEININDPDSVKDLKTLFQESMFPPSRAVIFTLKVHFASNAVENTTLECLGECITRLRAFAEPTVAEQYNEWFAELLKIAPDFIYDFLTSQTATCGPIVKAMEVEREIEYEAASLPRGTMEMEKSQMLRDIF